MKPLRIMILSTLMVLTACAGANFEPAQSANEVGIWDAAVALPEGVMETGGHATAGD